METLSCYLYSDIELEDLEIIAQTSGYETHISEFIAKQLVVNFDSDDHDHWFCDKAQQENGQWQDLWYDDESDYEKLKMLAPVAIIFVNYHPPSLLILAKFLATILEKYGGFVECRGGLMNIYTIDNIDKIVFGCP